MSQRKFPYLTHQQILEKAEIYAATSFFDSIEDENEAYVIIDAGNELGIPPFQAMKGIYILSRKDKNGVVKKTLTYSGTLIASMILSSGKYTMNSVFDGEGKNLSCKITVINKEDGEISVVEFSMNDAKTAGLLDGYNKDNYTKYARNMLYNRCIGNVAKWVCADIFGGVVYTPEELAEEVGIKVDGDGNPIAETEPEKKKADKKPSKAESKSETPPTPAELAKKVKAYFTENEKFNQVLPDFGAIAAACKSLKITLNPDNKTADDSLELVSYDVMIDKLTQWANGKLAVASLKEMTDEIEEELPTEEEATE